MEVESGMGGRDFMDEEEAVVANIQNRKIEDHSSALAEKLLQGWTLLNEHCPQCLTPLVRNRQKKMYCAACRQWILTEAEAAARAIQQRVDRSDLAEQSCTVIPQQPALSSSPRPGALVSPSFTHQTKGNGVAQIQLSLADLRAAEEKFLDRRNAKRFASGDHEQDGIPRVASPLDVKENGNQNGSSRPGVSSSFQHPAPALVPTKPALVLQPTVNPVNDILVARRTLTTLNEKLEGIRQLISNSHDVNELRQLFAVLEECIHAIEVTRHLLKSVE